MDVGGNDLVEHILNFTEILLNVPLDGRHLLLGVDLRLAALLRGPESALLFRPVRIQKDLEVSAPLRQLV